MDEPRITFDKEARTVRADYLIATEPSDRSTDGVKRHYASFRVGYDKGGMNYFSGRSTPRSYSASISRITEEKWEYGTTTSFTLFDGLGLGRSEPVGRYSEKGLRAYFEEAHVKLAEWREDERVARYFEMDKAAV
jgi:hypothetical protein